MKGIVFQILNELVEEKYGFEAWEKLLEATKPASEGIYTATELYPDGELLAYVGAISEMLDVPAPQVVHAFGEFMIGKLHQVHPEFFENHTHKSFLQSVHDVIHVEVKKLHPDAVLPDFTYEDPGENELIMRYHSPRKLCALAEGLIEGAGKLFNSQVRIEHPVCMLRGADHCLLHLHFSSGNSSGPPRTCS